MSFERTPGSFKRAPGSFQKDPGVLLKDPGRKFSARFSRDFRPKPTRGAPPQIAGARPARQVPRKIISADPVQDHFAARKKFRTPESFKRTRGSF